MDRIASCWRRRRDKPAHLDEIGVLNGLLYRRLVVLRRFGRQVRVAVLKSKVEHRLRRVVVVIHREERALHLVGVEGHALELRLGRGEAARKSSQSGEREAETRNSRLESHVGFSTSPGLWMP